MSASASVSTVARLFDTSPPLGQQGFCFDAPLQREITILQPQIRRIVGGFPLFSHPKNAVMVELHVFGIRSPRCQNRCVHYFAL